MFPKGCPPTTIISMNALFDPHLHVAVGAALRPLRAAAHKTLFIGSGGAVHNLYRNVWGPMLRHRDNFAQPTPPEPWALDFRQEVVDVFCAGAAEADWTALNANPPTARDRSTFMSYRFGYPTAFDGRKNR